MTYSPCFRQMRQNGSRLVGPNTSGHGVQNVQHHSCTQLQIEMRLDTLLGDVLRNAFGVTALKLTRQEVAEPSLEQRSDSAEEEHPHAKHGKPKTHSRPLLNGSCVEFVVNDVLEVLASSGDKINTNKEGKK